MAIQLSTAVRNAVLDAIEATISTTPKLQIRSGPAPASCAAADSGDLLCEIDLPSDWMAAASNGSKSKSGTWQGTASDDGTAGHFRVKNAAGDTTHMQGTVTATGDGGDMTMASTSISNGQTITVATFALTDPHN